jgi:putative ATPase
MNTFATQSQGDVRSALNALELAVLSASVENEIRHITPNFIFN